MAHDKPRAGKSVTPRGQAAVRRSSAVKPGQKVDAAEAVVAAEVASHAEKIKALLNESGKSSRRGGTQRTAKRPITAPIGQPEIDPKPRSPRPAGRPTNIPDVARSPNPSETSNAKANLMTTLSSTFADQAQTATAKIQSAATDAMQKSKEALGLLTSFATGNSGAVAEAGRILSKGLDNLANGYVADVRAAVETAKSDAKSLMAVRCPTSFLTYQANLLSRNTGAAVEYGFNKSEAYLKLAKDAAGPFLRVLPR